MLCPSGKGCSELTETVHYCIGILSTIQDVFNRFYPAYEKEHILPAHHRKAAFHIMNCKTGSFGINISVCEECGCISIHNNSCRDRCCPMCQEFPKEKWIDAQKENWTYVNTLDTKS